MGLKSFFNRKKKQRTPITDSCDPTAPTTSRSSSLKSRAQIEEELEQVFKKFDVNGDGKISCAELGSILASLGYPATEEELRSLIKEVDADGDGFIDLQEFIAMNTKGIESDEVMECLKDAFAVFDVDKNGMISPEELQSVLVSLGEECSMPECEKMISGVDCNGDGLISFEEFKVMMMRGLRFDAVESQ
ncbi:unnamed protein product [Ilex paraguariensis]|uniref:EF-hand domain-containing protein n=1 Tax=Ilex paraguariensis TaxID=185542 RepID=A0ABC8RP90_9AQUA